MLASVSDYLEKNADRFLEELKELLHIPTVSADPECKPHMLRGAEFIHRQFADLGFDAEIVPTAGHPIVYAEWLKAPGAPTVMVYGHYDVQPADPLDLWETPPFEPTIRDGKIYARGATDDKGQMFTHIKSAEAWLRSVGSLPVNLKYVIEGEEEVGSRNLDDFLKSNKERLKCDVAVISDGSQYAPGIPAINYGLRGIVACEITLHGPQRDLHSGIFGGSVANPVNMLARLIAALHDDEMRVQVPGFYQDVVEISAAERGRIAALPFDEAKYLEDMGVDSVLGEAGYSTLERRWVRPTCDVNGILGGYTGVGPKTIIPSKAMAKITCRLVPDQNPEAILDALETFLRERCPIGTRLDFVRYHGCRAFAMDLGGPAADAATIALQDGFGASPVFVRDGGSIPVVLSIKEILGADTLLLGWGLETDNLHSPNEHFAVQNFDCGIRASASLWASLAIKAR